MIDKLFPRLLSPQRAAWIAALSLSVLAGGADAPTIAGSPGKAPLGRDVQHLDRLSVATQVTIDPIRPAELGVAAGTPVFLDDWIGCGPSRSTPRRRRASRCTCSTR